MFWTQLHSTSDVQCIMWWQCCGSRVKKPPTTPQPVFSFQAWAQQAVAPAWWVSNVALGEVAGLLSCTDVLGSHLHLEDEKEAVWAQSVSSALDSWKHTSEKDVTKIKVDNGSLECEFVYLACLHRILWFTSIPMLFSLSRLSFFTLPETNTTPSQKSWFEN